MNLRARFEVRILKIQTRDIRVRVAHARGQPRILVGDALVARIVVAGLNMNHKAVVHHVAPLASRWILQARTAWSPEGFLRVLAL
jgi:hypothetical protein